MHLFIVTLLFASCRKSDPAVGIEKRTEIMLSKGYSVETQSRSGGLPTLVFLNGTESLLEDWNQVIKKLPATQAYIAYNRPGLGRSENISGERDAKTIAHELKDLLRSAGISAPYILVGHSMGGIYARMFYHLYPSEVKGLVLVDASHEKRMDTLISLLPEDQRPLIWQMLAEQNELLLTQKPAGAIREEYRANFSKNYEQIAAYPPISTAPVYVLTSLREDANQDATVMAIQMALHQPGSIALPVL